MASLRRGAEVYSTDVETAPEKTTTKTILSTIIQAIITHLSPIQERLNIFRNDPTKLHNILDEGRDHARSIASGTMKTVKERMGIGR